MKRLKNKLRSRGGTSLVELLVVLIILVIMTAMGAMGATEAYRERNTSIRLANAQTLASSAMEVIVNELRFGKNINVTPENGGTPLYVTLDSPTYGPGAKMTLDGDGHLTINNYGVLSGGAYTSLTDGMLTANRVLKLKDLKVSKVNETIKIEELSVVDAANESAVLWKLEDEVTVRQMNKNASTT